METKKEQPFNGMKWEKTSSTSWEARGQNGTFYLKANCGGGKRKRRRPPDRENRTAQHGASRQDSAALVPYQIRQIRRPT